MNELISFAKQVSLQRIPDEVIDRAKLILLDSLSAIALGNQNDNLKKLRMNLTSTSSEIGVPAIDTSDSLEKRDAAFINGIAMVSDELDEGNPKAKGHPAAHFLPALLSLAITEEVSGEQLLLAFIVNYEISARLGETLQLKGEIHPHGNWGVFGNGFGVGTLLGWQNDEHYMQASMLSSSFSFPTLWKSVLEGHEVRNVIVGLNNYNTMLLPNLVHAGFTASLMTREELFSGILAKQIKNYSLNFEKKYYLLHSYFKFYAYCRFCHAPIDAAIALVKDIRLDDIKNIYIETYSLAAKLDGKKIANEFAGMFSIPYAVANELYLYYKAKGQSDKNREQFIKDMMDKIHVTENEQYTKQMAKRRKTAVKIELSDGTIKENIVNRATGDADEDNLHTKVLEKNKTSLEKIFDKENTKRITETILQIDELNNVNQLRTLLVTS